MAVSGQHINIDDLLVYDIRLTSISSKSVTGDYTYEPSNMDLAMKLHYIRVVYFFRREDLVDVDGSDGIIKPTMLKESIFTWLDYYFETTGRFRRSETTGRPYIKCNDCGARFVEAKSGKTADEWMEMKDNWAHRLLVPDQVIGPDLASSPTTLLQMTFLRCGGIAVGLSWAHVLGDAFSLAQYMNTWARHMLRIGPDHPPNLSKCQKPKIDRFPSLIGPSPLSVKQVGPVGDHWIRGPPSTKMGTYSIHLTSKKLAQLQQEVFGFSLEGTRRLPVFETICAVIWRAIAKSKGGSEPNTVTVIKNDGPENRVQGAEIRDELNNNQLVSTVKAELSIVEARVKDLAALIHDGLVDERAQIAELVGKEDGKADLVIYGANLTFVNWEEVPLYRFGLMGVAPCLVSCFVDGVGDQGVILVLPGPPEEDGRMVTLILPESGMLKLTNELKQSWSIE